MFKRTLLIISTLLTLLFAIPTLAANPHVLLTTSIGDIELELDAEKAPISVKNFLDYVNSGFYNGTIFHRVIPGFMIQGGGFTADMQQKKTNEPIKNEADNGLKNLKGTIAMARTASVNSATSQFFINVADNTFLDHGKDGFGYAVFGKVVKGIGTVENIEIVNTKSVGPHEAVPVESVIIVAAKVLPE